MACTSCDAEELGELSTCDQCTKDYCRSCSGILTATEWRTIILKKRTILFRCGTCLQNEIESSVQPGSPLVRAITQNIFDNLVTRLEGRLGEMVEKVRDCTRITLNSQTMVDLLFTDNQNIGALVLKSPKWSDHDIIHFLTGGVSGHPKELVTKRFRDCSKIDKSKFQQLMMGQKWETLTDVDSSVDQFYARRVTVEIIPMQVIKTREKPSGWFYKELKQEIIK
ncbi:hypothetical protein HHI36_024219 [Cryptolaemus montrouzieri]|uniref:Uncharacterized protein n=1 Tax=Cryptolaemus montrouzieri TaxID=559131 RepID=A0ABD2NIT7_9CUCU